MKKQVIATTTGPVLVGTTTYGACRVGINQRGRPTSSSMSASPASSLGADDIDPKIGKGVPYWYDPMVSGQHFGKPGKSLFMDMQLAPVYTKGNSGTSGITVGSRVTQSLGVHTAKTKAGRLSVMLEASGNITIDEHNVQVIQAHMSALVQHAAVRTTLDPVWCGQALMTLYSPDQVVVQEEYLAVLHQLAHDQTDLASTAKTHMLQAGTTPGQVSAVGTSGWLQPSVDIASPIDNIVTEVAVWDGMTVFPGMTLLHLADLSQIQVAAEVSGDQAHITSPGLAVKVLPTGATEPLIGKANTALPGVNPATWTIEMHIILPNKGRCLLPGIFATAHLDSGEQQDVLTLPLEAVTHTGQHSVVTVDDGQAGFVVTEIKTGREAAGMVETLAGLKAGQEMVAFDQFLINSEVGLRSTIERMAAPAAASAPATTTIGYGDVGRIGAVTGEGLMISHGLIPLTQWGTMTMESGAPPAGLPEGLEPGDRMRLRFHLGKDGMAVLSFVVSVSTDQGGKP